MESFKRFKFLVILKLGPKFKVLQPGIPALCFAPGDADKVAYFPPPAHRCGRAIKLELRGLFHRELRSRCCCEEIDLGCTSCSPTSGGCNRGCSGGIRVDARGRRHPPPLPTQCTREGVGGNCRGTNGTRRGG